MIKAAPGQLFFCTLYYLRVNHKALGIMIRKLLLPMFCLFLLAMGNPVSSSEGYAVIYVHRLKKSTNSGKTFKVFFNDEYVGKFKGVNKAFSAKSNAGWIVAQTLPGKYFLRIIDEGKNEKERIIFTAQSNHPTFIEFDPSAAYGYNCLRVLTPVEGYQQVLDADKKEMQILDPGLKEHVGSITMASLLELQEKENQDKENTIAENPGDMPVHKKINKNTANQMPVAEETITSDVDVNIPSITKQHEYRYALIIGNEDYRSHQPDLSSEVNVKFARRDALVFKEYALKALGIPEQNILFELDADAVTMSRAINKINLIIKNTGGNADVFFYYAGHGLPDERTKEPYLIPVNVSGNDLEYAIKLSELYKKLNEHESKKITVFIDACFSGGAREQGLVEARGVKIKPNETFLAGNIVSFSASSGTQSSLPYKEKGHGLFTYYLLKYLQETKGEGTYGDLSKYLQEKIGINSVLINNKEQNPSTNVSQGLQSSWKEIQLSE